MTKVIETHLTDPHTLTDWEKDQVYNGLDCCVTAEVLSNLLPQLDATTSATYAFSRSLQGPVLEMRLRGVRIDNARRWDIIDELHGQIDELETTLDEIVSKGVGFYGFNWRSHDDLKHLFYDKLRIPEITYAGKVTVNRKALEKMSAYFEARPIVSLLIAMRDLGMKIKTLRTAVDDDGRIRTSYNIGGTVTGRFSSSLSEFGTGGNLQNIEENLRSIFIADEGHKLAYLDAKSGESYCVGAIEWNLFKDPRYLDACESGDPHTMTARWTFPKLGWTGDLKHDRAIAEQPFYRHRSYRDICKNLGHGTNYKATTKTLSQTYAVPLELVEGFQNSYLVAFPSRSRWWGTVDRQLREKGFIVNLTGRKRQFWGRRDDSETLREAIAYDPQGSLADIVNRGMLNVWRKRTATLLMHNHDAVVVQYPEKAEDQIIPLLKKQLEHTIALKHGRSFTIPYDCKTGWNWGKQSPSNPDGLKDYTGHDKRKRQAEVSILDQKIRRVDRKY